MRGRLSGADDAPGLLVALIPAFGPGMDHEEDDSADHADCVPPLLVWIRIGLRQGEGIIEHEPSRLEAETVVPSVRPVFV